MAHVEQRNRLLEQTAEDYVMTAADDAQALGQLASRMEELASLFADDEPETHAYLLEIKSVLDSLARGTEPDAAPSFQWAGDVISALQSKYLLGRPTALPPHRGPDAKPARSSMLELNPLVDEELFRAFIEQQMAALPQLEGHILDYEKTGDPNCIKGIFRLIHTMKGEAGVVGIMPMQQGCHLIEDYLDKHGDAPSTDALLMMKDWLAEMVDACATGRPLPDTAALEHMQRSPKEETPQPAAATPSSPRAPCAAPPPRNPPPTPRTIPASTGSWLGILWSNPRICWTAPMPPCCGSKPTRTMQMPSPMCFARFTR